MAFFVVGRAIFLDQQIGEEFAARFLADQHLHVVKVSRLHGKGRSFDELVWDFAEPVVVFGRDAGVAALVPRPVEHHLAIKPNDKQIVAGPGATNG